MKKLVVLLTILFVASYASAEITVHEPNFVVDTLLPQIDGQTPRLEAIRNFDYGFGVIAVSIDNGIMTIKKITQDSVEVFGTMTGFTADSRVGSIRFDRTGLFSNQLYLTVWTGASGEPGFYRRTHIFNVSSDGTINNLWVYGNSSDEVMLILDFTKNIKGYLAGAYMEDLNGTHGTKLYHMDPNHIVVILAPDLEPNDRTDIDIWAMEFDSTGLYGSYLTMADSDENSDDWTVIYQLMPNLSWLELTAKVRTSVRSYRDLSFSSGGSFGQVLYVTEKVSESIMSVDPNGTHAVFASGFSGLLSVTISEDGNNMFVSDENGVYRIRAGTSQVGPQIVMREPWVEDDDVHTGELGVDSLRLLWNESIIFENADVNIVNEDGNNISFSVSGSNSQFMIIVFGETLLNDKYTITIYDSVVSAVTGVSIDGDKDGLAGGDAVIVMEHRERHDSDNDNDIDMFDFADLADKWLWQD